MSKLPWQKFFPADFMADVQALTLAARGAWITLLCAMWRSPDRGRLSMTLDAYSRLLGCSDEQAREAIYELVSTETCDCPSVTFAERVTLRNAASGIPGDAKVTLESRRMIREEIERNNNAMRQARYREKRESNGDVTQPSNGQVTPEMSEVRCQKSEIIDIEPPLPPLGEMGESGDDRRLPPCPYGAIRDAYNEICGAAGLTKCNEVDPDSARGKHVKTLWRRLGNLEKIKALFATAAASDLLRGINERGWIANFDFVVKPANVIKIEEGAYARKAKRSQWAIQEPDNPGMPPEAQIDEGGPL